MKRLDLPPPSEAFPVIEEGEILQIDPQLNRRVRQSHSFTTFGSDEILAALSNTVLADETETEDEDVPLFKEEVVPYAPDGGYGWVIVFAAFLANFVLDGISVSQSSLMEDIRNASGIVNGTGNESCISDNCTDSGPIYEITVAMYGLISSVLICTTLVAGPFVSLMVNRYGFRHVAVCGSLLAATGIFISWGISLHRPNIWGIILFFGGFAGLGFGMMFQPSIIIVGMYFDRWRPLATGLAMMGTGAGTIVFPPLLSAIGHFWSWQEAYLFQGFVALASALFALLYAPLPTKRVLIIPKIKMNDAASADSDDSDEEFDISNVIKDMSPLFKSPTFVLLALSGTVSTLGFFGPYAFLVDKAVKELNVNVSSATFLLSILGIANTSGRLIFGLISCHPWINSLMLSNLALTIAGIANILLPFTTQYYQLVIFCIVFGFCISIFTVLRSILVVKLMGMEHFSNAFGLCLLFLGIGTLFGNPIGGWLKDYTGNYDTSFYVGGACLLLSGIMCYPLQRMRTWELGDIEIPAPTLESVDHERYNRTRRHSLSVSMSLHI